MSGNTGEPKKVRVIQTARDSSDRLTEQESLIFETDVKGQENSLINIYPEIVYQEIVGFGGAFTEAGAVTLAGLSAAKRAEVLNAYFNADTGLGYNLCRTHINSCDFSLGNYSYDDVDGDVDLVSFGIDRDQTVLIPFIKDALKVAGGNLKVFASPWSPPAWMKTNREMNRGGKLKDEYRGVWARYFCKYIKAYAAAGIDLWGLSVQNEPNAVQTWDSCIYTAEEERDFVRDYLGPVLAAAGLSDIKIIIWDHNKDRVYERAKVVLSDPQAARYIWGIGFHWYSGDHFENLDICHEVFPEHPLIFTEGSQEGGMKLGAWEMGERYGHEIIGDLNHWTVAWTDWNMLLDESGGPNHAGNYCNAPLIIDTKKGTVIYQSAYYYLGHFTKYIRPGAKRIGCTKFSDKLEATAFQNPDGKIAVVVLNQTEETIPFFLRAEHGIANAKSWPHSIMTLMY